MSHEPGRDGNASVSLDLTMEARQMFELEIKAKACCPSCVSPLQPYSLICGICGHPVVGESPLSRGQWLYGVEDSSGYLSDAMSDSISDISDPPDVACNDLSDDESDCEYSDEDSASSTESYDDFIRRRAQAVLAAKEAQINLKFARKRAEIEYKLIDMEKEAQLLQLKVETIDEMLFFKQTGCVKIRSKPLDSGSDTHRPKVCDTHLPARGDTEQTTHSVENQAEDSSVKPVAPPAEVYHVISDTCSKVAQLKAGSLVIINNLQRKVINLETEMYGYSLESDLLLPMEGELDALSSLTEIHMTSVGIIQDLQARVTSLQRQLSTRKCEQSADILSGSTEAEVYVIPEMEMNSGCETQSSSECVSQPPGGDFGPMIRPPIGGCSKHLTPSGGDPGGPCNGKMKLSAPPSSKYVCQPPGGDFIVSGSHLSSISPPAGRRMAGTPIGHQPSGGQILSRSQESTTAMPVGSTSSKVRLKRFAEQTPHSGSSARLEPPSGTLASNSPGDLKYRVKLKHFPEHVSKETAMSTPSVPFNKLKWFPSQEGANEKFKDLQQLQVACC